MGCGAWLAKATQKAKGKRPAPAQSRQPPPAGAQAVREDVAEAVLEAKEENFCSTCFQPHLGHAGGSWLRLSTSFSKTSPHFGQAYSKIGMRD